MKGVMVNDHERLKWKERKEGKKAETEKERRGSGRERDEESMRERVIDGGVSG